MPRASQSPASPRPDERRAASGSAGLATGPRHAYRAALGRYKGTRLAAIRLAQGTAPDDFRIRPAGNADEITEHLEDAAAVQALFARLSPGSRLALGLYGLSESTSISVAGLSFALRILSVEPAPAIIKLLDLGLLALDPDPNSGPVDEFGEVLELRDPTRVFLCVHPTVSKTIRTTRPEGSLPVATGPIGQIREPDGLEAVLRVAALWQRVGAEPLRQTQQGELYKRDRDRIDLDPVLSAPIADAFVALADSPSLWLALARRVGLIELDAGGERLLAADHAFWADNEFHLQQMIATSWLALQDWHELKADAMPGSHAESAAASVRPALLLWLSTLAESEWVALEDLADDLTARWPAWVRLSLRGESEESLRQPPRPASRGRARTRTDAAPRPKAVAILESILLGAAYPLGLIRAGEESLTKRRVVQLSALGRYVLAAGPTPPPRAAFEKFLFVQPNFEVIAYRQGLTSQLVGRLSRFAWWTQIGSALELKLSRESIVFGLERGAKPKWMLETLTRHSQHSLSRGVVDAINNWAERRERVIFYTATTLIEFGDQTDRDRAVELWPQDDEAPPVPVADRFLLVEDERAVPYARLRLTSSRDYRRPPEVCVAVEPDGVTLALDATRADLLVDAELIHFADSLPTPESGLVAGPVMTGRRFQISGASLQRGINGRMDVPHLREWFERRTGSKIPPSVQLLLAASSPRAARIKATRMVVLTLPNPELLEGLRQHPATSPFLGERLGPTSVAIPENLVASLQSALNDLGMTLDVE